MVSLLRAVQILSWRGAVKFRFKHAILSPIGRRITTVIRILQSTIHESS